MNLGKMTQRDVFLQIFLELGLKDAGTRIILERRVFHCHRRRSNLKALREDTSEPDEILRRSAESDEDFPPFSQTVGQR